MTPFFIDSGAHPRLPLSAPHVDHTGHESPVQYAQRTHSIEATVQETTQTAGGARNLKAKLDAGLIDTVFKVGDRVLLRSKDCQRCRYR